MSGFDYSQVMKVGVTVPISDELAMDYGLIPDTRPARPPLTRRQRLHLWQLEHLTIYALRQRLATWIDPNPCECYR